MMTANPVRSNIREYGSIETRCGLDVEKMHAYEGLLTRYAKDKVVCDIGTGPGILAFIALKAGAKKVYCIDDTAPSLETAKINLRQFGDRVVFIQKDAGMLQYPEDIDLIVHEVLGSYIYDENIIRIMKAVKKSGLIHKVRPHYYEMFSYVLDEAVKITPTQYDESKFPPLTVEFHKLYENNFPGVIKAHSNLGDIVNVKMQDIRVFHTWSMADPDQEWGQVPRSVLEDFRLGKICIGWKAYLEPDLHFGNYPREANNWLSPTHFKLSLTKRFLNQVKLVEDTYNPFREETCQFLK